MGDSIIWLNRFNPIIVRLILSGPCFSMWTAFLFHPIIVRFKPAFDYHHSSKKNLSLNDELSSNPLWLGVASEVKVSILHTSGSERNRY